MFVLEHVSMAMADARAAVREAVAGGRPDPSRPGEALRAENWLWAVHATRTALRLVERAASEGTYEPAD
jgi:hypothetical protein